MLDVITPPGAQLRDGTGNESSDNARTPIDRYALDRQVLTEMTEAKLRRHAQDMLWVAEFQPSEVGRKTFDIRRDMAVAESERRSMDAESIRAELCDAIARENPA